jgi:hypothetical protein
VEARQEAELAELADLGSDTSSQSVGPRSAEHANNAVDPAPPGRRSRSVTTGGGSSGSWGVRCSDPVAAQTPSRGSDGIHA